MALTVLVFLVSAVSIRAVIRLAVAEHYFQLDTPESVAMAIALAPGSAEYHVRNASFLGVGGLVEARKAVDLNPGEAMWWIEASVIDEIAGDEPSAEHSLFRATQVSRYYLPRMMLASYYFRHRDLPKFQEWAKAAMLIGETDPTLLLQMAQQLGMPTSEISKLVPDRVDPLAALVQYEWSLLGTGGNTRPETRDALYSASQRLLKVERGRTFHFDSNIIGVLFDAGRPEYAVELWNALVDGGRIGRRKLSAVGPIELNFAEHDLRGFDWDITDPDGVALADTAAGGVTLGFSGQQPQLTRILSRRLPLQAGKTYRLTYRASVVDIPRGSGLVWRVRDKSSEFRVEFDAVATSASPTSLDFTTPQVPSPYWIELWYQRSLGTTRISGSLELDSIQISPLP